MLQPPQLLTSDVESTQLGPQASEPTGQLHMLALQPCVAPQATLHMPQFAVSIARLTQPPLQLESPGWQLHIEAAQTVPAAQTLPHMPQLALLVARSTQESPHRTWPAEHAAPPLPPAPGVTWRPGAASCVQPQTKLSALTTSSKSK